MTPQTHTVTTQAYLPVKGINYLLVPEVMLLGENLWKRELYTQRNDLDTLPSRDINIVAEQVREEEPNEAFLRYAREQAERLSLTLSDGDVAGGYRKLHEDIWNRYGIAAKEILMWTQPMTSLHPRIVSGKTPAEIKSSEIKSFLLTDYRVEERGEENYVFNIDEITPDPIVSVDWLRKEGTITPEMARLLGASKDTYVWTDPNPEFYEGLRALFWGFGVREGPALGSDWDPWGRLSYGRGGSLLGRKL